MKRLLLLTCAITLVLAFPALAQGSSEETSGEERTSPDSSGHSQYQYDETMQSIDQAIEDAIEDARANKAAVEGAEAYVEGRSPESSEAEAAEAGAPEAEAAEPNTAESNATEPSASSRYQSLPDTGGSEILAFPVLGAVAVFLAGGWLMRRGE